MEMRLDYMLDKPYDFKICKRCGEINWFENSECFSCGSNEFKEDEGRIVKIAKEVMRTHEKQGFNPNGIEVEV